VCTIHNERAALSDIICCYCVSTDEHMLPHETADATVTADLKVM